MMQNWYNKLQQRHIDDFWGLKMCLSWYTGVGVVLFKASNWQPSKSCLLAINTHILKLATVHHICRFCLLILTCIVMRLNWIYLYINPLRLRQNGRLFADDTFKRIFLYENVRISIKISLKFVPKGPINNIPSLVQMMAWRLPGDKPLSEPLMVKLLTHICVTRPQWVYCFKRYNIHSIPIVFQYIIYRVH